MAPSGLPDWDHRLRTHLAQGAAERALELVEPEQARAGDELLRLQHEGLIAHYAGEWERSADAFERAFRLTEDRYTKSVSRAVLSMLASDRVLDYYPPPPERLLLHYYAALDYLRRGERDEAAVEARRLGRLLETALGDDGFSAPPDLGEALSHFAGAVFEAAGQPNDADVAYRRARAFRVGGDSAAANAPRDPDESAAGAPHPIEGATGELVVVVERGFVAHKVEEALTVFLPPGDVETLREVGRGASSGDSDDAGEALAIARRVLDGELETGDRRTGARPDRARPVGRDARRQSRRSRPDASDDDGRDPVLLRIAWPVYRETSRVRGASTIVAGRDTAAAVPRATGDLSAAVKHAYADRRALDLAKTLARAAAKTALAEGLEEAVSEEDETLGEVAGWSARIAGALLERADTRCWHLLPARLELHRLRLPPGTHRLEALLPGREDAVGIGPVEVAAGRTDVVSVRVWD